MPGLNQRGPDNMGPMTGRRMGRCATGYPQDPAGYPGQAYGRGYGQGYGQGYGYGQGRGCGRGFGPRGRGAAFRGAPAGPVAPLTKEDLNLRAKALEQELEAVKNELKNFNDE